MLSLKKIILNLVFITLLYSCTNDRCIDADDFGFAKFTVSARYPKSTTVTDSATGEQKTLNYIEDYQGKQVGAWLDTGYQLNGQPLTIMVKNWSYDKLRNNATASLLSAWSPWFGKDKYSNSLPPYLYNLRSCKFANNDTCATAQTADNKRIVNAPCLMKQGIGLYGLITTQKRPE
jgi:type IV secretion system protein VirB6